MSLIYAATPWKSNAELIEDLHTLGYINSSDYTLDPTYGKGTWWKNWQPDNLVTSDIKRPIELSRHPEFNYDFREMDFDNNMFDVIAFDPPYVSVGGRKTSTIDGYQERYGMDTTPKSPRELQLLINAGLKEMYRLVRPKGIVFVKCQDYISSGKLWMGTQRTLNYAGACGFECVDKLEHIGNPRPQPEHKRQVHARRNVSTMFVLKKSR